MSTYPNWRKVSHALLPNANTSRQPCQKELNTEIATNNASSQEQATTCQMIS